MGANKMRVAALAACIALACLLSAASAFYLPGVAPQDYATGELLQMKVNKLSSVKTQLPYEYYTLPYCKPDKVVHSVENLGEVIRGDRIENSVYSVRSRGRACARAQTHSHTHTQARARAAQTLFLGRLLRKTPFGGCAHVVMMQNARLGDTLRDLSPGLWGGC